MIVVEPIVALALSVFLAALLVLALAMIWVEIRRRDQGPRHTRAQHAMGKPGRRR